MNDWTTILKSSIRLVERVTDHFDTVVERKLQDNAVDVCMLGQTNRFVHKCLKSVHLLNENDYRIQSVIVCRTAYEASIRMLWASRAENGWPRMLAFFAKQDLNTIENLSQDEDYQDNLKESLDVRTDVSSVPSLVEQ